MEFFLLELQKSNPQAFKSLQSAMTTICAVPTYRNDRKFKQVKGCKNRYGIKILGIRLYCFRETFEGLKQPSLIIAASRWVKPKPKRQRADIDRADQIRNDFQLLKTEEVEVEYQPSKNDEN